LFSHWQTPFNPSWDLFDPVRYFTTLTLLSNFRVSLQYLRKQRFPDIWRRLKKNSRSSSALLKHLLLWFDRLKTLKLINHLTKMECRP
jgi:hypothetical protein